MQVTKTTVETTTYVKEFKSNFLQIAVRKEGENISLQAIAVKAGEGAVLFQAQSLFDLEQIHKLSGKALMIGNEALNKVEKEQESQATENLRTTARK
jgi:hypothetical protein